MLGFGLVRADDGREQTAPANLQAKFFFFCFPFSFFQFLSDRIFRADNRGFKTTTNLQAQIRGMKRARRNRGYEGGTTRGNGGYGGRKRAGEEIECFVDFSFSFSVEKKRKTKLVVFSGIRKGGFRRFYI
jgi:hypothetical protein